MQISKPADGLLLPYARVLVAIYVSGSAGKMLRTYRVNEPRYEPKRSRGSRNRHNLYHSSVSWASSSLGLTALPFPPLREA
jgi:hypothetical protein